jgi:hypothetical protein
MDATQLQIVESEEERVVEWREEELLRAGYPAPAARKLALRPDIDLHKAVDLIRAGCDPTLATRILL